MSDFNAWLQRRGQQAMRSLWKLATDEQTPAADRQRLLTYFAEMALGKARTMDAPEKQTDAGTGVVVLPDVMATTTPPDFTV